MSQWTMWVVGYNDKRLSREEDDFLITDFRWDENARGEYDLIADVDKFPEQHCTRDAMATMWLLTNLDSGRQIHVSMRIHQRVNKYTSIICNEIRFEGDLLFLFEEYLPTRPK